MKTVSELLTGQVALQQLLNRALPEPFSRNLLKLDCALEVERICALIREQALHNFHKKGVVVGLSGGIDSSAVATLAARALGRERVLVLLMPERDSSPETMELSHLMAKHLGVKTIPEDISGILEASGCYHRRDQAIRLLIPEYGPGWKSKLVLPDVDSESLRILSIVALSPDGRQIVRPLSLDAHLGIIAATNFKQRTRKMLEYYHADRLNYAVAGTPNRLEYDQGFFVKLGDGAADIKPIAHLYKTQVYQLAEYLQIPPAILRRPPTTDTYSLPQTQQEFYFSLPYDKIDLVLYGKNHGYGPDEIAPEAGLSPEQVSHVFRDIEAKRRVARYLHAPAGLVENV